LIFILDACQNGFPEKIEKVLKAREHECTWACEESGNGGGGGGGEFGGKKVSVKRSHGEKKD